ncbi:MAG: hypothetical protein JNK30_08435 [Phenylobacterium sp.]|uniref:hypothetical protein n=1 Tax=Phenylobacterium sp. TaxID=1871053 RepID=UPI001A4803D8|nr:hypothetical protein [Phenylobacterium sp.]MBL8771396.1 hypothetical protein [Phenylobacterium sp.]
MSWFRSSPGRALLALLAATGLLLAVVTAMRLSGFNPPASVRLGIGLAAAIPALWFVLNYWRSLDEAAQEAQKWAWFWGGSAGLGFGVLAIAFYPDLALQLARPGASAEKLMLAGATAVMAAQLIGFLVAWAFWWWRRR